MLQQIEACRFQCLFSCEVDKNACMVSGLYSAPQQDRSRQYVSAHREGAHGLHRKGARRGVPCAGLSQCSRVCANQGAAVVEGKEWRSSANDLLRGGYFQISSQLIGTAMSKKTKVHGTCQSVRGARKIFKNAKLPGISTATAHCSSFVRGC